MRLLKYLIIVIIMILLLNNCKNSKEEELRRNNERILFEKSLEIELWNYNYEEMKNKTDNFFEGHDCQAIFIYNEIENIYFKINNKLKERIESYSSLFSEYKDILDENVEKNKLIRITQDVIYDEEDVKIGVIIYYYKKKLHHFVQLRLMQN